MVATGGTFALVHARPTRRRRPLAAAYNVPGSKLALVKIDFVADEDIDDVAFEITLPDGLRFVSGGERARRAHLPLPGQARRRLEPDPRSRCAGRAPAATR